MSFLKKVCLLLTVCFIASCENFIMYRSYQHISKNGWYKSDTLECALSINDSLTNLYQLRVLIRNQTEYKYQNLTLAIEYNFPDTTKWATDTVFFHIADSNANWLGKGISGLYENSEVFHVSELKQPGNFTFKITSLMNDSILTGINDIGIIAQRE